MNISDLPTTPFGVSMPASAAPTPLARQRVDAALTRLGVNHGLDEDGDAYALWDGFMVRFISTGEKGEVFQIRGLWERRPAPEVRTEVLDWINAWHTTHRWPMLSLHDDGGKLACVADFTLDLEYGVTDDQLDQFIRCAIGSTGEALTAIAEAFPAAAEWELLPGAGNDDTPEA